MVTTINLWCLYEFICVYHFSKKTCRYLVLLPYGGHILYLFFITGIVRFKEKRVPFLQCAGHCQYILVVAPIIGKAVLPKKTRWSIFPQGIYFFFKGGTSTRWVPEMFSFVQGGLFSHCRPEISADAIWCGVSGGSKDFR